MRHKKTLWLFLLIGFSFLNVFQIAFAQIWSPNHAIGTVSGKYHFSYQQTPDQLVEIFKPGILLGGITYQWEQSSVPTTGFTDIPGAVQSSYSFPAALSQTTYFRRKTIKSPANFIYSNIIKITVVSIGWEDINYLREHEVHKKGVTTWQAVDQLPIGDKLQTTSYLDGLGRPVQQISRETATPAQGSSLWGDVVQFSQYDAYGREPVKYLPYTTTAEPGKYKSAPLTQQPQYYTSVYNETSAFTSITFDNSPLNRVKNVKDPGTAWAASAGNSAEYEMNSVDDQVQVFFVDYRQGYPPIRWGSYDAHTLYKVTHTDEKGKKVVEYTNKAGQLILRKVQLEDNPSPAHEGWICTYSIYDDFGLLCYELQPEAVKYLEAHSWSFDGVEGQKVLSDLCFQYHYDEKGRTTWKKAPGAEPLRMIYDIRDRVVFMQDGNQAAKTPAEWTANLYDELDRPVMTTLYRTEKTVAGLQSDVQNSVALSTVTVGNPSQSVLELVVDTRQAGIGRYAAQNSIEFIPNGSGGFESIEGDEFVAEIDPAAVSPGYVVTTATFNNPIPASDLNNPSVSTVVKYQFYDEYSFSSVKPFDPSFDNTQAYPTSDANVMAIAATKRTLNFTTGSMTRVLGTNTFLSATNYYDEDGRLIQSIESNLKWGGDVTTLQYHFDGRLLSTHHKHTAASSGYSNFSTLTKHVFDKIGRITSVQKKWGTNEWKTIADYAFDDVGRLKTKRLDPGYTSSGKTELESLTYSYNIHSNITGINKDYALKTPGKYDKWGNFFGLYLGYDNRDNVFNTALLNGQVSGLLWSTQGEDVQRKYDYSYDHAGRLVNAAFKERQTTAESWNNTQMDFSVSGHTGKIEYDLNGNLLSMLHKGVVAGSAAPVTIDDLRYSYASLSNKLLKVSDLTSIGATNGQFGDFRDGANGQTDDYVYDANGNLVIDLNKGVKDLVGSTGGIRYNFLDKPEEIRIAGKGTINILYDADGNKLQKKYTPENSTASVVTTYINGFVYQGEALQYIGFEEGRIRVMQPVSQSNGYDAITVDGNMTLPNDKEGVYDYFIRDYQENVRMILTEEVHQGSSQCTMETTRAAGEEAVFGQVGSGNEVAQTRFAVSSIPGQTTGGGWQNTSIGSYVSRLSSITGKKTGPNTLLKVMAGDVVSATTQYWYQNPVVNSSGSTLVSDVLGTLVQAITGSSVTTAVTKGAASNISSQLNLNTPFKSMVAPDAASTSGTNPKAYLTVLFFDERFNFVGEGSSTLRVGANPGNNASLTHANIKAPKNGYCFVYVSNESSEMVYFDNLRVGHTRGHIIEENHYYAYGLKIAAISSRKAGDVAYEGLLENKYLYNDKELWDEGDLNWYDYGFRNYDPQIGRFVQLDPLAFDYPYYTPYQYAGCEPIANIDIDGLEPGGVVTAASNMPGIVIRSAPRVVGSTTSAASSALRTTAHLGLIAARGAKDALMNANTLGLYDAFGGNHLNDYIDPQEKKAYLQGRIAGDGMAIAQGGSQFNAGSGAAGAGFATGPGAIVLTTGGAVVAAHGAGVGAAATIDLQKSLKELYRLNASAAKRYNNHHIATDKNNTSTANGGPWTPRFKKFFDNAGLDMSKGNENIVRVLNHKGPHPEEYHKLVFDRLLNATKGLKAKTPAYRDAIIKTLEEIGKEAQKKGSKINKMITK